MLDSYQNSLLLLNLELYFFWNKTVFMLPKSRLFYWVVKKMMFFC